MFFVKATVTMNSHASWRFKENSEFLVGFLSFFIPPARYLSSIQVHRSPSAKSICAAVNPEFGVIRPVLGRPSSGRCVGDRPIKLERTFPPTNIFEADEVDGRDIYYKCLIHVLSPK